MVPVPADRQIDGSRIGLPPFVPTYDFRNLMVTLRKINYYGDFFVYPVLLLFLAIPPLAKGLTSGFVTWVLGAGAGAIAWTLVEYLVHRFAFHKYGPLVRLHAEHHDSPRALLGAPTWLTATVIGCLVLLPLGYRVSWNVGMGTTFGIMAGYLWYVTVHHVVHHRAPRHLWRLLAERRRYHDAHHYDGRPGNFGVTFALWDRTFHTWIDHSEPQDGDRTRTLKSAGR